MTHLPKKLIITVIITTLILIVFWLVSKQEQPPKKLPTMTVAEKKARFTELLVPAVEQAFKYLSKQHQQIADEIASSPNSDKLAKLRKEYRAKDNQALLIALKPHPKSIALAQAAMESSWATSRFALEANNIFGVWSFDENDDRIAAGEQRGDKTIWLKKYSSIEAAVIDYYRVIARGPAFAEFRQLNSQTSNPHELVKKLDKYSEKGALYGEELSQIINFNKFNQYDK